MPAPAPRIATLLLMLLLAAILPRTVGASVVERALMPGDVAAAHADTEDDCKACHVSFERAGQAERCMGCHEDVGADVRARHGFHGRLDDATCSACHAEHRGRDARLVDLDASAFDHRRTDFDLAGAHRKATCASCHATGRKHREAPSTCHGCHAADDRHRGKFGDDCAECHAADDWKTVEFDHARTGFTLRGAHRDARCEACHAKPAVEVALQAACSACHAADDPHRGGLGSDCERCHVDTDWRTARFDHSRTGFALEGAHGQVACADCHRTPGRYEGLSRDCAACHRDDDRHRGSLGRDCATCHGSAAWSPASRFDHGRTRFALDGGHRRARCADCHRGPEAFRDTAMACVACHRDDDTHQGRNGEACADCHANDDWKRSRFDHDRATAFPLRDAHRAATCEACHAGGIERGRASPRACIDCHAADDTHRQALGSDCAACHDERDWKRARFDHSKIAFPLLGAHAATACAGCHADARFRAAGTACVDCHRDDDAHGDRLGPRCADCHNTRAWSLWEFDHDRRTRFALLGAHRRVACVDCHQQPGRPDLRLAIDCGACHAGDDPHQGGFGADCGRCHGVDNFRDLLSAPTRDRSR